MDPPAWTFNNASPAANGNDFLSNPTTMQSPHFVASNNLGYGRTGAIQVSTGSIAGGHLGIIQAASHEMLMQSGNIVYGQLRDQNFTLTSALEAQKTLISTLQAMLTTHTPNPPTVLPPSVSSGLLLAKVESIPFTKIENRGNIRFYYPSEWDGYCKDQTDLGCTPNKLDFLEDAHGAPVSRERRRHIVQGANTVFNNLYFERMDPHTWSKKVQPAADYYYAQVTAMFPELQNCDGGKWKAEKLASIKYSDWCRDTRAKGTLKRRVDSIRLLSRGHARGSFSSAIEPPRKKAKASTVQARCIVKPELTEIIDLSSDDGGNQAASDPVDYDFPLEYASKVDSSPPSLPSTSHGSAENPGAEQGPLSVKPPNVVASQISQLRVTRRRIDPLEGLLIPAPIVPTKSAFTPSSSSSSSPALELPTSSGKNEDTSNTGGTNSEPNTSTSRFPKCSPGDVVTKKSAQAKPSDAQTPRNLYCIDYLNFHPKTTAAEFKFVWDVLVPDSVKQEYKSIATKAKQS